MVVIETKSKKQYDTLDEAIKVAKQMNLKPDQRFKLVGYKCNECHKYHIGKNNREIKDKERNKWKTHLNIK